VTASGELVAPRAKAARARNHPWAIAGLWAWQTALALGASWPATSLAQAFFGASPRGDAELWAPGGYALIDSLWHGARALAPTAAAAKAVLLVGTVAGLLPMAASMSAMAYEARHHRHAGFVRSMTRALGAMPALLLLLVLVDAAQAGAIGLGLLAAKSSETWFEGSLGDARAERLGVALASVFVLAASGMGVVHDLARAVVVRSRTRALRALARAWHTFGRAPLSIWWSWAWRTLTAMVPVLAVAAVATRIGGRGGMPLFLLAMLHQGVVLSRVAIHLSWLASALRAVE
jgi:hypothetical protein